MQLLPMALLGPAIYPEGAADAQGWARWICRHCLLVTSLGPIPFQAGATNTLGLEWVHFKFAAVAANALVLAHWAAAVDELGWAHYVSSRCYRYIGIGPLRFAALSNQ